MRLPVLLAASTALVVAFAGEGPAGCEWTHRGVGGGGERMKCGAKERGRAAKDYDSAGYSCSPFPPRHKPLSISSTRTHDVVEYSAAGVPNQHQSHPGVLPALKISHGPSLPPLPPSPTAPPPSLFTWSVPLMEARRGWATLKNSAPSRTADVVEAHPCSIALWTHISTTDSSIMTPMAVPRRKERSASSGGRMI